MPNPRGASILATVSPAERVLVARKTTNRFAIANPDSDLSMVNVLTSMNVANLEHVTQQLFAVTHLDHSPALVRKVVLEMLAPPVANLAENVPLIAIVQPLRRVGKAVVLILALVLAVKEPYVKLSDINLCAHARPEPKATHECNVDNWNVWKTPNVPWAAHVFKTNVLTLVA